MRKVTTKDAHGLTVDDQILITGVGSTDLYNGTYELLVLQVIENFHTI